jgi:hypothetical protein
MAEDRFADELFIPLILMLAVVARVFRPEDFPHIGRQASPLKKRTADSALPAEQIETLFPGRSA